MQTVYRGHDRLLANLLVAALGEAGIDAHVVPATAGPFVGAGGEFDDVSVWVAPADLAQARVIATQVVGVAPTSAALAWVCACGEINPGTFEVCWNCDAARTQQAAAARPNDVSAAEPESGAPETIARPRPDPLRRRLWIEVGAVLSVLTLPYVGSSVLCLALGHEPWWWLAGWMSAADVVQQQLSFAGTVALVLFVTWSAGTPWSELGWVRPRWRDCLWAVPLLLLTMACYGVAGRLMDTAWSPTTNPSYAHITTWAGSTGAAVAVVSTACWVGLNEELLYRGYLVPRLEHLLGGRTRAVAMSAVLFAVVHAYQGVVSMGAALVFAGMMGVAFTRLRRLWPLVLAHAAYDAWAMWDSWVVPPA